MPDSRVANNYKEEVTDEQLLNLIEAGVQNSVGDWLNSSDLTRERLRSTYEYAGVADFHLAPQGVSTIVDTSTTEVIEAYTAVLSELFLNNNKIAAVIYQVGGVMRHFVGGSGLIVGHEPRNLVVIEE